ncbi:MAG: hypothetical protein DRJ69_06315 [Thermoprotei archaeon]|nr:MAG: hypothetical protein DRJ69_06315 [Thermoprotei archaeon]
MSFHHSSESVYAFRWAEKYVNPGDSEKRRVIEVELTDVARASHFARKIVRLGGYRDFEVYNVDVPAEERYLYETGLYPTALIHAEQTSRGLMLSLAEDPRQLDYKLPPFKRVLIEVEADDRMTPSTKLRKLTIKTRRDCFELDGCESEILIQASRLIEDLDPDLVFTRGGDSTVLQYLAYRAASAGVREEFYLSRDKELLRLTRKRGRVVYSYGRAYYVVPAYRLFGRIHLDLNNSFILAQSGYHGLVEVARACRMDLHRAARAGIGTIMSSAQFYEAIKSHVLIPWRKTQYEEFKDALSLLEADRGGLVLEPEVGLHFDVWELDFSSMYPQIMLRFNISPDTINCSCCPDSPLRVPEVGYRLCVKRRGLIPRVLEGLIARRLALKNLARRAFDARARKVYERRQAALKWILVSCFGYLGYKNAKFGRVEAHQAVCAYARELLLRALELAREAGFEVVHAIVDSLWVRKPGATRGEVEELAEAIEKQTSIPVNIEGRYEWIVFAPAKSRPGPALSRYFGVFEDGELKLRGLMARRSDTPRFIKALQESMLHRLARSEDPREACGELVKLVREAEARLRRREVSVEDLAVKVRLSRDPEDYVSSSAQALAAKLLRREGYEVHAGQVVRYIYVKSAKAAERRVMPVELNPSSYDVERYAQLLWRAYEEVAAPLGLNVPMTRLDRFLKGAMHT